MYESDYWSPGPKYEQYLDRIIDILTDEQRTVRDVYYALEARGFAQELDDPSDFEYRYVKRAVKKGRRAGFIDPGLIYDASRQAEATVTKGYDSPEQFARDVVEPSWKQYDENFWEDQPTYVEVWLEKQSLASVFAPICREHNVRLEATRGDWSDSKIYEAANRLRSKLAEGKDVRVLYFGDYNPSGLHAPVAVQNTMRHYGLDIRRELRESDYDEGRFYFDLWPFTGALEANQSDGTIEFERIALNTEHIAGYDLPENPTPSSTDKDRDLRERFQRLVSGRDVNVELNALKEYHRDDLERMLEDAITKHIDGSQRGGTKRRVQQARTSLREAITVDHSALTRD